MVDQTVRGWQNGAMEQNYDIEVTCDICDTLVHGESATLYESEGVWQCDNCSEQQEAYWAWYCRRHIAYPEKYPEPWLLTP